MVRTRTIKVKNNSVPTGRYPNKVKWFMPWPNGWVMTENTMKHSVGKTGMRKAKRK